MFSGEEKDIAQEYAEITEEEKQKYRDAWGQKFQDEVVMHQKEWEELTRVSDDNRMSQLSDQLSEPSKRKCEFLADRILEFNPFEARYLSGVVYEKVKRNTDYNPLKLNMDWSSIKMDVDGSFPPLNPNWFKQQELMSQIGPLMGTFGGGNGAAQGGGEEEEEQQESPDSKEKDSFDIELSGFEAKSKIKLIKEIRALFNLGLKEAKETVEGAPLWLKKGVKKEEAEELIEKLTALGAELKMV
uniref:Large ribosomal subunit protein bL12 C-terminal domain-containing protein n=1 Tax=Euplotes crassus TaxID=5936 RepID=A0A7S3KH49_EUPCR|mmetsp:Transcript_25411/g.25156  ORF Transcript_25411/g.25156 Transcript_25411/m.25156 type:complete len:243 (+) Transcript_25411:98-826(+)|eukprot:CAMPEP_0197010814 /NCGR_PEP_ID=MMETSP1380-20130617/55892_1 /TAXON_ID=5936 /ORGANISM="Euplotes crassus, Strain CT5" /LENGTH=242 /DNA_ID=CAMNT_0042432983 /DNA_START=90 /DNA_END=818 /DNA_ORIENTATION=-